MNHAYTPRLKVRAESRASMDQVIVTGARLSLIAIGIVVLGVVLEYAQVLLAPLALAVVIGLMFGPLADRIERLGIPPWASGLATVSVFLAIILVAATGFAVPLSAWLEKLPIIWSRLQSEVTDWRSFFTSIAGLQEQLREAMGQSAKVAVAVDGGSPVEDVAYLAPAILGQIVLFLAGLYFFVATRHRIRIAVLSLFFSRRLRWRIAHVFRDAEQLVSTYLFHITALNIGLGLVVSLALWLAGVPSALLWGMLAGVLNYVIYIGPAMMVVLLLGVGLASATTPFGILTPPLIFLLLNFIEAQFVTPLVLGRTMTLNPFVIFLAIVFWIWIWGPVGGFIAVPSLLVLYALIRNTFPARS